MTNIIGNISIFKNFTTEHKAYLYKLLETIDYKPKDFIIQEGDSDKNLYIILKGTARVLKKDDMGDFIDVSYITPGNYFGELSLIDNKPRSAYVQAADNVTILTLSQLNYSNLCLKFPEVEALMLKEFLLDITLKLRNTTEDAINQRLLI